MQTPLVPLQLLGQTGAVTVTASEHRSMAADRSPQLEPASTHASACPEDPHQPQRKLLLGSKMQALQEWENCQHPRGRTLFSQPAPL
jgi:hypothetical protein